MMSAFLLGAPHADRLQGRPDIRFCLDDFEQTKSTLTEWALQGVAAPDLDNQLSPTGTPRGGGLWRCFMGGGIRTMSRGLASHAPAFVAIRAVVTQHGHVLWRQVVDQRFDKLGGAENFKVASCAPVFFRTVEHVAGAGFVVDLFEIERAADEVFGESPTACNIVCREGCFAGVEVESAVVPGKKFFRQVIVDGLVFEQSAQDGMSPEFGELSPAAGRCKDEGVVGSEDSCRNQQVEMGVPGEVTS